MEEERKTHSHNATRAQEGTGDTQYQDQKLVAAQIREPVHQTEDETTCSSNESLGRRDRQRKTSARTCTTTTTTTITTTNNNTNINTNTNTNTKTYHTMKSGTVNNDGGQGGGGADAIEIINLLESDTDDDDSEDRNNPVKTEAEAREHDDRAPQPRPQHPRTAETVRATVTDENETPSITTAAAAEQQQREDRIQEEHDDTSSSSSAAAVSTLAGARAPVATGTAASSHGQDGKDKEKKEEKEKEGDQIDEDTNAEEMTMAFSSTEEENTCIPLVIRDTHNNNTSQHNNQRILNDANSTTTTTRLSKTEMKVKVEVQTKRETTTVKRELKRETKEEITAAPASSASLSSVKTEDTSSASSSSSSRVKTEGTPPPPHRANQSNRNNLTYDSESSWITGNWCWEEEYYNNDDSNSSSSSHPLSSAGVVSSSTATGSASSDTGRYQNKKNIASDHPPNSTTIKTESPNNDCITTITTVDRKDNDATPLRKRNTTLTTCDNKSNNTIDGLEGSKSTLHSRIKEEEEEEDRKLSPEEVEGGGTSSSSSTFVNYHQFFNRNNTNDPRPVVTIEYRKLPAAVGVAAGGSASSFSSNRVSNNTTAAGTMQRRSKRKQQQRPQNDIASAPFTNTTVTGTNRRRTTRKQHDDDNDDATIVASSMYTTTGNNRTARRTSTTSCSIGRMQTKEESDDSIERSIHSKDTNNNNNKSRNIVDLTMDAKNSKIRSNPERPLRDDQQKVWSIMFDRLVKYKEKHGDTMVPICYSDKELGNWVHTQRKCYVNGELLENRYSLLQSIDFVWDPNEDQWMEMYNRLIAYKQQYRDTLVHRDYEDADGTALGEWVSKQRKKNKNKILSNDRYKRLKSIGFIWGNIFKKQWMEMYQRLIVYKTKYRSTRVSYDYKDDDDTPLGVWVYTQRHTNKYKRLSNERYKRLKSIGFIWDATTSEETSATTIRGDDDDNTDNDDTNNDDGTMNSSASSYICADTAALQPVQQEQVHFKSTSCTERNSHTSNSNTCPRQQLLSTLSDSNYLVDRNDSDRSDAFVDDNNDDRKLSREVAATSSSFSNPLSTDNDNIVKIKRKKRRHPARSACITTSNRSCSTDIETKEDDNTQNINKIHDGKKHYKLKQRPKKKQRAAASIDDGNDVDCECDRNGDDWTTGSWTWPNNDNNITSYHHNNVRSRPYQRTVVDGASRAIDDTTNIVDLTINNKNWSIMFDRLVKYKAQHGDTLVPSSFTEDRQLGMWVRTQRVYYRNGDLLEARHILLKSLDFVWDPQEDQWMDMYHRLISYKMKYKSTRVPRCYKDDDSSHFLGIWVDTQRKKKRNNEMPEERYKLLDTVGFVWDVKVPWMDMYHRLLSYKKKYKSTRVPRSYLDDDGTSLGNWASTQRQNNELSEERYKLLDTIGFVWDATVQELGATGSLKPSNSTERNGSSAVYTTRQQKQSIRLRCNSKRNDAALTIPRKNTPRNFSTGCDVDDEEFIDDDGSCNGNSKKRKRRQMRDFADLSSSTTATLHEKESRSLRSNFKRPISLSRKNLPTNFDNNYDGSDEEEEEFIDRYDGVKSSLTLLSHGSDRSYCCPNSEKQEQTECSVLAFKTTTKQKLGVVDKNGADDSNESSRKHRKTNSHDVISYTKIEASEQLLQRVDTTGTTDCRGVDDATRTTNIIDLTTNNKNLKIQSNPKIKISDVKQRLWSLTFNRLVGYKEQHGDTMVPYRFPEDKELGLWVSTQRTLYKNGDLLEVRYNLLKSIDFVWNNVLSIKNNERWMEMYHRLFSYKMKYKSARVPRYYKDDDGTSLGYWVHDQRTRHSNNKMSEERYKLLDSIGFLWNAWNDGSFDDSDDDNEKKSAPITRSSSTANRSSLQIEEHATMHPINLQTASKTKSADTYMYVDGADDEDDELYEFTVDDSEEEDDEKMRKYERRISRKRKFESPAIMRSSSSNQTTVRVKSIRKSTNNKNKTSSSKKICRVVGNTIPNPEGDVDDVGARTENKVDRDTRNKKHDSYYDNWTAGSWTWPNDNEYQYHHDNSQRQQRAMLNNDNTVIDIADERTTSLKSDTKRPLTNDQQKSWAEMFNKLVEYKERHGHTMVPRYRDDNLLGTWVQTQRTSYSRGELLSSRYNNLKSIDFVWNAQSIKEDQWMHMFHRLLAYKEVYKHTMVPQSYENSPQLGNWVKKQRFLNARNELLSHRYDHLHSIGFVWNDCKSIKEEEKWMTMYQQLVSYKSKYGSTRVPYTNGHLYEKLCNWVSNQRMFKRKNILLKNRFELLESIDFVWDVLN